MLDTTLIEAAKEARTRAYAPYSKFAVGAALRASSGRIYLGCNVENAAYPVTLCAERVAVFTAVCAGEQAFEAIAVVTSTGGTPCGSCRQVLREFVADDFLVIVADLSGNARTFTLGELLPASFSGSDLGTVE